ncbi:efflux RND transporter periplasmic adaptor subunit [Pedobacter immunditicola]|uniref:efflux RND transporter periplasmic adaptor subunit n=1 Tax=Pedobacter immunditicola TaxID=3133440 RepID=UPI0030B14037
MKIKYLFFVALGSIVMTLMQSCTSKKNEDPVQHAETHDKLDSTIKEEDNEEIILLTPRDEQHANLHIDTIRIKVMAQFSTVLGTANFDQQKISVITSRIPGRLDELFVRNPQQYVKKGQPLYAIYSEELQAYKEELITAHQARAESSGLEASFDTLIAAARRKLMLLGLTNVQIAQLEKNKLASPLINFYSPVSGTLTELDVSEGQYVEEGTALFRIADISQLWIEAQMYPSELRWLNSKTTFMAEFDTFPGEMFKVVPVFDNPALEADSKISLVRFKVDNSSLKLKPGMMAYINIRRGEKKTLVIPKSSIVVGEMITAWVKTGNGKFENRIIKLGIQNKKEVEVLSGLKEGELIVTNGAYLLNSALVLKKGSGMSPMEGMEM